MFLGAVLLAATTAAPDKPLFEGIWLGENIAVVRAEHPDATIAEKETTQSLTWQRKAGGTIAVYAHDGNVTRVTFDTKIGEGGTIEFPCAHKFNVEGSHMNMQFAAEQSPCHYEGGEDTMSFTLPDGSIFEVEFYGPYDGPVRTAS